jgi:hypothetical protein
MKHFWQRQRQPRWQHYHITFKLVLLFLVILGMGQTGSTLNLTTPVLSRVGIAYAASVQAQRLNNPQHLTPFMYRPYYGNTNILQRTISFMDHDEPWYANDGVFVRYDGATWRGGNSSVYSCTARLSCYDGHNGYDLNFTFEPVLSVAGGTVIRAGWYNALNHSSSFGLWAAIDHGNGVVTAYGHLSALLVAVGDHVGAQWQIGTSGTTGASTGPHLHFSTYFLPSWNVTDPFGWYGRGTDPNTTPDYYLWTHNPTAKTVEPYLGGNNAYSGALIVDDSSAGWSGTGYWRTSGYHTDIRGGLHFTSSSAGSVTATSTWRPVIPANGYYEVAVYVDDTHATSSWVPYTVYSANPNNPKGQIIHTVRVDASHIGVFSGPYGTVNTGTRWVTLGTYYFHRGTSGRVVMTNATGESGTELAADAVEFVRTASW